MIYLGPFYPTNLLHPSIIFVKLWKDPRFCILSADSPAEIDKFAKGIKANRAGRIEIEQGEDVPEYVEKRPGRGNVLYILSPPNARKSIIAGVTVVNADGDFSRTHQTISALVRSDNRKKCVEITETSQGPIQCDNDAMKGRATCRLHSGEGTAIGGRIFTAARYKGFLPEKMAKLYEEALNRPDLLELENQIAILDAKMQTVFAETGELNLPSWDELRREIERLDDPELGAFAKQNLKDYVQNGSLYDSKWNQVHQIMEQQRKLVDTEIRRKKELNLMVPVDRVMVLMASVADVIKRHVQDPEMLAKIKKEMGMLMNATAGQRGTGEIVDMM